MNEPSDLPQRSAADFKEIWEDREFWSCFGYEGLSIVFGLPLKPFEALDELQKRAMMRLLSHLAKGEKSLQDQVAKLASLQSEERLIGLVALSEQFAPQG